MQIDYVITWVDGQDPTHKALRKQYLEENSVKTTSSHFQNKKKGEDFEQTTKVRFQDNGELYFNIASVLQYAPFIRKIYIVTDHQTPQFLQSFIDEQICSADFLQIISHDEIFTADEQFPHLQAAQPNFNSRSIEAALWRIPGLSEHFIFSNDDFFLNAPVSVADFFTNNLPTINGDWKKGRFKHITFLYRHFLNKFIRQEVPARYGTALWRGAQLAGQKHGKYLSIEHRPHPLRKSTFAKFYQQHQNILQKQIAFRFRSYLQYNPVSLANHLEVQNGVIPKPSLKMAYLNEMKNKQEYKNFLSNLEKDAVKFGCIQDLGLYPLKQRQEIYQTLLKKFEYVLPEIIKTYYSRIN